MSGPQVLASATEDTRIDPEFVGSGVWDGLMGMHTLKSTLERRVMLPITERSRAEKHGLNPPVAILLFGPPGTGKTVLAKAMAGRLGWALVNADLSTVSLDPSRLHGLLKRLFQLEHAVVFLDEFEYLGRKRSDQIVPTDALTAELLREMSAVQASGRILIICATNHVGMLDRALLRPGRFDLVLPVGLPDAGDRAALLRFFLQRHRCGDLDLDVIVQRTETLTAAELQSICQRAAQTAFEREVETGQESSIRQAELQLALEGHRPGLSQEDLQELDANSRTLARY